MGDDQRASRSTLVWKYNAPLYSARKTTAVRGQYAIWPSRDGGFYVWNRKAIPRGLLSEQFVGTADSLDQAKALAQAHADHGCRIAPSGPRLRYGLRNPPVPSRA
jgi:hypothetical protein